MTDIRFYIITPVYNAQAFLADCAASVRGQTYGNFELILVDDESPDGSGALCDALAAEDSRIHVIHQKNTGPFGARRAGIRYVLENGNPEDYLMFLDSDDTYRPNTLETVLQAIRREQCDLVFFGMDNVENGKVVHEFELYRAFLGTVTDKRQLYKVVFGDGWYNPLCRKAAKLAIWDHEDHPQWYPIRFGEDLLQSICLYKNCEKAVFLPDVLYNYTVNWSSATNTVRYDNYKLDSTVLTTVWDFLETEKVWTDEDFEEYLCWCRTLTRIQVWTIAKFETGLKNRYRLLDALRTDRYYGMVLGTAAAPDLWMIRRGIYFPLCLVGSGMKLLGNFRRKLRKRLG